MLVESVYNPGVMGGHVCLINLLPNFSFEKSWTILAHLNKNPSVFIHNTIDFGKKLFFRVFCVCFGIEFQTLHVLELTIKPYMFCNWLSKKWLRSTFPSYTSRNHYLFWLFIGVMEKETILNIMFIFKSIDATVLTVLPYSFFDWTTFPKLPAKAPALLVRLSFAPELIFIIRLPLFFSTSLGDMWLLGLSSC